MKRLVRIGWFREGVALPFEDGVERDLGRTDDMNWPSFGIAMGSICLVQCHEE